MGLRSPGKVEVLEGLEIGDTVVVAGQQRVPRDGMVVSVVDLSNTRPGRPDRPGEAPASGVPGAAMPAASAPVAAASIASATVVPAMPAAAALAAASTLPSTGGNPGAQAAKGPNPCDELLAGVKPVGKPSRKPA